MKTATEILMTDSMKSIAPYTKNDIEAALIRLAQSQRFIQGIQYFHPHWSAEDIRQQLKKCQSCTDFEIIFVEPIIKNCINQSINNLQVTGLEGFKKEDNFLYISNHRDIFLDAGLLQYALYHRDLPFTEISLGDNLMVDELIETVAKMNNMFTVYRSGSRMELLRNAQKLSAYLRYAITEKKVSAWIAQGNGRTKNGHDKTFPGLVNMLLMSGGTDYKKSLQDLNIVVSSVSYEYEPCAFEKAIERHTIATTGHYTKFKHEDMYSILKGIKEPKGNVSLAFERLNTASIDFSGNKKEILKSIVTAIDKTIYKNYQLWKTNYMAYDMLHQGQQFEKHYTRQDVVEFKAYLNRRKEAKEIVERVLEIYATPILNRFAAGN